MPFVDIILNWCKYYILCFVEIHVLCEINVFNINSGNPGQVLSIYIHEYSLYDYLQFERNYMLGI